MFPEGRAYASRALNIAKSLLEKGNEIDIIADYISDKKFLTAHKRANCFGIEVFLTFPRVSSERSLFNRLFAPFCSVKNMKNYFKNHSPDIVILSSAHDRFSKWYKFLKKKRVPIILENCEWFDYYNFHLGHFSFRYHQFKYCWNHLFTNVDGVISISRLIQTHFEDFNIPTIRIPGLCDSSFPSHFEQSKNYNKIKIVYEGDIYCGKEDILSCIDAVSFANPLNNIELHIFGPTLKNITKAYKKNIPENVFIYGFVSHDFLIKKMSEMHFGIIFRPNRKSSHAGFPTKLVDYFSQGLPVISNDTGDIGLYLKNNFNGYLVHTINDLYRILCKTSIDFNAKTYEIMKKNALETAKNNFNYSLFSDELLKFLNNIIKKKRLPRHEEKK